MKTTRIRALAALPFALAACGGDDAAETGAGTTAAGGDSGMTAPAATAPATDSTLAGAQPMGGMVTMNAVGGSGVTGQAQFMEHGTGQTMVTVDLTAQGSTSHSGHIHQGTCEAPGAVVVPLKDVTLASGTGMASSTIGVPLATVMNGQHIVAYHERSGEDFGGPVVCGAIPAMSAASTAASM
jgi:hypothetical protein